MINRIISFIIAIIGFILVIYNANEIYVGYINVGIGLIAFAVFLQCDLHFKEWRKKNT